MRQAGEVTYADAHRDRKNEGYVSLNSYHEHLFFHWILSEYLQVLTRLGSTGKSYCIQMFTCLECKAWARFYALMKWEEGGI